MNKLLSIASGFVVCLFISHAVVAQPESLGAAKYTPPEG